MVSGKTSTEKKFDVIVIGAGVAGLVAAYRLHNYGYRVAVCASNRPIVHSLQSIHPSLYVSFKQIGLGSVFDSDDLIITRSRVNWGGRELDVSMKESAFLIDRRVFDQRLKVLIVSKGVPFFEDISGYDFCEAEATNWKVSGRKNGAIYYSDFLVIAHGRQVRGSGRFVPCGETTLALVANRSLGVKKIKKRDAFVFSQPDFWCWSGIRNNQMTLSVFIDPKTLSRFYSCNKEKLIEKAILSSPWQRDIQDSKAANIRSMNATPGYYESIINNKYICIGDAAICSDPLSSQGIQVALASAVQGMICVHTILQRPQRTEWAVSFYQDRIEQRALEKSSMSGESYRQVAAKFKTKFWRLRSSKKLNYQNIALDAGLDINRGYILSDKTRRKKVPFIEGEFINITDSINHHSLSQPLLFPTQGIFSQVLTKMRQSSLYTAIEFYSLNSSQKMEVVKTVQHLVNMGILIKR